MDILSYLSELIQTRKLVGIPGLGTIYKKKSPGRYDTDTHSFVPPSYTLDFTEEVREETELAAFISKNRGLSIAASNYFIHEFSNNVLRQLNDHQEADLETIGKLSMAEGRLVFKPANALSYGFDFYGLPSIKAEPAAVPFKKIEKPVTTEETPGIAADQGPIAEQDQVTEKPTPESVAADNEATEENPGTSEKSAQQLRDEIEALQYYRNRASENLSPAEQADTVSNLKEQELIVSPLADQGEFVTVFPEEEKKTTSLFLKILLAVLILLILLTGLYILKPDLVNGWLGNNPATPQAIVLPQDTLEKTAPVEDSALQGDTAKNTVAAADTVKMKPVDTASTYEIIGASVLNQKEADYFIHLMKKSGISAKVVTNMPGRRLKMSIATLKDKKSADLERERLEKKLKIDGIYIYRNKPQ